MALWLAIVSLLFQGIPGIGGIGALGAHGGGGGYTGPLDLTGWSSNVIAWSGLRCSKSSYTGNVADIWDASTGSTTETKLTCSTGGTINQTINNLSVTCAISCVVATLYDQTGLNGCTTACDYTQATNANRPIFLTSCPGLSGNTYCMSWTTTSQTLRTPNSNAAHSQPWSISAVGERTSNTTTNLNIWSSNTNASLILLYRNAVNSIYFSAGLFPSVTANDNAWHTYQGLGNATSSNITVNGSSNTVSAGSGGLQSGVPFCLGVCTYDSGGTYNTEFGVWSVDQSANFGAMNTNQKSYYGF